MKYWRTMLIASALGVCGLAVWASDEIRKTPKAAPVPAPVSDPRADVAFPPATAAEPSESEPPTRVIELAATPAPPTLPVAPPVVPPPLDGPTPILPIKGETPEPPPLPKADLPPAIDLTKPPSAPQPPIDLPKPGNALPSDPPPIPKSALDLPPAVIPGPEKPVAPMPVDPPTLKLPAKPFDAPKPLDDFQPSPPPTELARATTVPKVVTPTSPVATSANNYKLYVRMGGNLGPRFEVKDGDTLLLKVYCDKIDLHGAQDGAKVLPGLTASGRVRVTGSGLNGTCDSLTLASVNGEVSLKGNVRLTCYRGNHSSQVNAETMSFQLKGGEDVPAKKTTPK